LYKNYLQIFPTSRAIRVKKEEYLNLNSFLPKMATVADFETKAITYGKYALVDKLQRALYLKEATNFQEFTLLKKDLNLIKFYTNAQDFFRFFEEVSAEGVEIEELYLSDTYAEFEKDLELLEQVYNNYRGLLNRDNFTDRVYIPKEYKINKPFIESFDGFILELEGYLTKFELELFNQIAKIKPFIIKIRTTSYNQKIINAFSELGVKLPINSICEFDLNTKEIINSKTLPLKIDSEVIEVSEELEEIAVAFAKIEEFVQSGIKPENIALIVPDESIVSVIRAFDRLGNFNFAMGRSFREFKSYKILEQITKFLSGDKIAKEFLTHNGFNVKNLSANSIMGCKEFFAKLVELKVCSAIGEKTETQPNLKLLEKNNLLEKYYDFNRAFKSKEFDFKIWLFLWLNELSNHSLDDVSGGKVTVMGLLESRGVSFDGVVIIDFNEGVVPSISNKDRFLNTQVRAYANLPTKEDRENLQKHYYARVLEKAKSSVLIYRNSDSIQPSKFIYELNLAQESTKYKVPLNILFDLKSSFNPVSHLKDTEFEFNAKESKWSAYKLKTYLECKRKFYYRYIKGLKEAQSDDINEGRILHEILSKVITPKSYFKDFDSLKKALMQQIWEYETEHPEILFKKPLWSKIFDDFITKQIEHFSKGWQVEKCEFQVENEIAGLKFYGRIDRMDIKNNFKLIIDYKSGSIAKATVKDVEKLEDFQMNIYARLLDLPVSNSDYMFIEILNGGKENYVNDMQQKDEKLIEHIEYLKSQKTLVAEQTEDLQKCRYCAYQLLCHRGEYL